VIREIDILLTDWAAWTRRLHSTALGYPTRTAETRVLEGRTDTPGGRARVPVFTLPERLLRADRAVRDMPGRLRLAVEVRYLADLTREGQEAAWHQRTRQGRRQLYAALDAAHYWLDGRLSL
jgi:hypothetical protein